ncbi:hypothetical protein F441_16802 [Phytophthora nicotianae CJ01A1]|uniref:Uncharacterized protein n=3 Tax=Phytophthora nicotianae TaxID=4792 RepID=V9ED22_PHYNI|nr:hypothetical protein F443_16951 [Phytophthora nicotianae P1569]ETK77238.1 hypothetical protein L915_16482 [Phytophthora nicotianae]ETL30681.1 hypothetical protein L916_16383 [Phytophthora nicotianae]ETM37112.1 hypothetical protein L914_16314 [Phytophthora nicotianae]ETP06876.1 hypothetical protein F441_16802 [Phytophthora nicotianae CJ01A1]
MYLKSVKASRPLFESSCPKLQVKFITTPIRELVSKVAGKVQKTNPDERSFRFNMDESRSTQGTVGHRSP